MIKKLHFNRSLTRILATMALAIFILTPGWGQIVAWQFGSPAAAGNEATYNATTNDANLNTSILSRGTGVASTPLGRAFAATTWDASATKASAITNSEYYQFSINAKSGYQVSLSTLDVRLRRSGANAPNAYIWKYSLDGSNFTEIGSDISFTSTVDGVDQTQISLSGISAIQNVTSATTITFRLYAWGGTSTTATFSIGRYASGVTTNSLAIGGTVVAAGAVLNPVSFTAITATSSQINLAATANVNSNNIVVVYNATGTFTAPTNGSAPTSVGTTLAGSGGTIVYAGAAASLTNHTGLTANTAYYYKAFSYDGSNTYSSGITANATTAKIEPSNQVTNFAKGTLTTTTLPLTWTAAIAGSQLPDGYLLKLNTSSITDPVDGTDPGAGSLAISSGAASYKVTSAATTTATFTSAIAGTMYNVKIYSYTNTGSLIDFKTTAVPTVNFATLPAVVTGPALTVTGPTTSNITWTLPGTYVAGNHSTLVFVKATSAITAGTPTNAPSAYTANAAFSLGTVYQGDASAYCVYNGDGTSVSVSGLTGNTTYHVLIYTVVDASNSDVTNSYSTGATANATTAKTEPSNQPTSFAAGAVTTSNIPVTWVAAVAGSQLPDGYLLKVSTTSVVDPEDGIDPADDLTLNGGTANRKVTSGTSYSGFSNWTAGTMYNFKIYSYTNSGTNINFNLNSPPAINHATLPGNVTGTSFTATGTTTSNISWTLPGSYNSGNHSTLVFVKAASSVTAGTPTNAPSVYTANTTFGSGTAYQNDANAFCVYNGDGSSVSITGLIANSAYYVLIYTVVDASNSNLTNSYSASATFNGTTAKIEPENQVTNFAAGGVTTSSIPLNWTAAVAGNQLPDGYLIKLSAAPVAVVDPVDGTDPSNVTAVTGGLANKETTPGSASSATSFTNMVAGTMYNYKIYSYTNSGTLINFNLTSPPAINHATLPAAVTGALFAATESTTANISWSQPGTYSTSNHSSLVFVKEGSAVTQLTPSFNPSAYNANTLFASGTAYQNDAAAFCVYNGDGTTVSITGLNANTTYHVLIYTVVDASNSNLTNSYSAATTANGITLKIPVSVPYTQDFESSTPEWTLATTGTNKWAIGSATSNGGSKGLYISNDNGTSNSYTISSTQTGTDASFRVDLTGLTAASIAFDWKSNGEIGFDFGEVYINTGSSDVLLSESEEFISTTTYSNRRISLTPYVGGIVTIKFRWINDGSAGSAPPFAVDNVSVAVGDVAILTTTTVSSITVNSAVTGGNITNGGGSTVTARGVVYSTLSNPTLANSSTTNGTGTGTFTSNLTGLDDNTTYFVRAYATNSTGTAYGNELTFATTSVSAPVANAATSVVSNGFTANWDAVVGATNGYLLDVSTSPTFGTSSPVTLTEGFETGLSSSGYVSTSLNLSSGTWGFVEGGLRNTDKNSGTYSCQLRGSSGTATSPSLTNVATLTFFAKSPSGSTMTIKKIVNTTTSTVATRTITSSWAQYTVVINDNSSAVQIVFENGSNFCLIDDVSIGYTGIIPSFVSGYEAKPIAGQATTSSEVSGLTANTTYSYRVRAVGSNSTSPNSNVISVTTAFGTKISGSTGDWNSITWSPSGVPVSTDNVTINHAVTLNGNADCNDLTIGSGGSLTLNSGSSLITKGAVTGSATVKQAITNGKWQLISSPVDGAQAGIFEGLYLQTHRETQNDYIDITEVSDPLTNVRGFALWGQDNTVATYVGKLNTGTQSIGITNDGQGWNLVGNPYPSAINWDASTGWSKVGVNNAIYVLNGDNWVTYISSVGVNGGTPYIAATQGFFVRASGPGTLEMNNNVRVHNDVTFYKNATTVVPNLIRLKVSGYNQTDETVIRFLPEATEEFDGAFDAEKLLGNSSQSARIYSLSNGTMLAINTLPETNVVLVGINSGASGTYTIAATEINDLNYVTLEDTKTSIFTELSKKSYTFDFTAGENEQRFKLHFSSVGVDEKETSSANIYSYQQTVYVNLADNTKGDIYIYNLAGQLVTAKESATGSVRIGLTSTGVYMVKVVTQKETLTQKVVIR